MAKTSVFGILQKVEEENFGVKNEALKMWSGLLRKKYQGRLRSKKKKSCSSVSIFVSFAKSSGYFPPALF
jgi:hypothetical protein